MPNRLREEMVTATKRFLLKLTKRVKEKLSGQVLNVRTGRLRRSIHMEVNESVTSVVGTVGTNVIYARPHEYGGPVTVKEHLRTVKQAWGRPLKEPKQVTVRSHVKNLPERSFLRSSLLELKDDFYQEVDAGVKRAMK